MGFLIFFLIEEDICLDMHDLCLDPASGSIQQGVYLLKPGPNKDGYRQREDGAVIDSHGRVLSPGICIFHSHFDFNQCNYVIQIQVQS